MQARTGRKADYNAVDIGKAVPDPAASPAGENQRHQLCSALSVPRPNPTLRMIALEKLRTAIISGELMPNTRLVERKLCGLLGVSRTIVRESLRQLESEGWVINPPHKGPAVASLSLDQATQMYEMREALEGLAARLCARRATAEQIVELEAAVDEMALAQTQRDLHRHLDAIKRFNEVLLNAAGNAILAELLSTQHLRLTRLRSLSLLQPQRAEVSVVETRRLVAAIKRGDEKAARLASESHIRKAAEAAQMAYRAAEAILDVPTERPRRSKASRRATT